MSVSDSVEDFIAWHFDDKGMFSVKQVYKLKSQLVENEQRGGRSSSSMHAGDMDRGGDEFWRRIWKAPIPPNIKQFVWRLAHNSLAIWPNLSRRGVELDNIKCLFCNGDTEEGAHLFVKCDHVNMVWDGLQLDEVRNELIRSNTGRQALDIIWNQPLEKRVEILTLL
jgi:hypothetical protein